MIKSPIFTLPSRLMVTKNPNKMNNNRNQPKGIIDIPRISNDNMYESNVEKSYEKGFDHCPCCGKAITNPKFFINSIYGGSAYPSNDKNEYSDAWVMGIGPECRKRFPEGYIFSK